ncbi:ATP-binding protein [Paenibacillus protaetiae]|uniref:histidine kinase n=1 Tax=Paenibacillus protaetiae TaxID=2509456 RepID=A0A4P6EWL0_9BACL|nr:ATP-binding protein [Paenibacillus protaetiae]QAY67382.1 PAS domain S-box protein [Paenibacillus protaetiae]
MSFKTKFTISISLLIMVVFVFLTILNESFVNRNIWHENDRMLKQTSEQLALVYAADQKENEATRQEMKAIIKGIVQGMQPYIKEFVIFNPSNETVGTAAYASDEEAFHHFRETKEDQAYGHAALANGYVTRKFTMDGHNYVKSYYSSSELAPSVLMIVYDTTPLNHILTDRRNRSFIYYGITLAVVLTCSYLMAALMLRPIKQIIWKINEVSLGRFQSVIKVKGHDEFSLLALKVNAMSQNLSIYMDKLRKAFEENRQMKEYLESFINHTSDAIHVADLNGVIIQVNLAFEKLFEYSAEEAVGQHLQLVPENHRMEMRLIIQSLMEGKVLPAQETERMSKSGEIIPVSVSTSAIRDSSGTIQGFASITRDMRSRNKMEELLKRSEKLTIVGELAAGVAHEIRNPLTTLRGFLQIQRQTSQMNPEHTNLMLSELDRINLIVGEFLILSKPQATRFTSKDVRTVFGEVLSLLESEAHLRNVIFKTSFTNQACIVSCEENQLKQVFINVLKNAIEAMPSGGNVHIHIALKPEQLVAVTITDEGVGIPEDMLPKIGQPFVTSKESGTGLGMMISHRIIQSHNGTMDIQSQLQVGTTVAIMLPALKEKRTGAILGA